MLCTTNDETSRVFWTTHNEIIIVQSMLCTTSGGSREGIRGDPPPPPKIHLLSAKEEASLPFLFVFFGLVR